MTKNKVDHVYDKNLVIKSMNNKYFFDWAIYSMFFATKVCTYCIFDKVGQHNTYQWVFVDCLVVAMVSHAGTAEPGIQGLNHLVGLSEGSKLEITWYKNTWTY